MAAVKQFKALVLGSGQGGTPLTMALAAAGHKVALVEGRHIGIQPSLPPLSSICGISPLLETIYSQRGISVSYLRSLFTKFYHGMAISKLLN